MICIWDRCVSLYGLLDQKVLQRLGSQYLASYVKKGIFIRDLKDPFWHKKNVVPYCDYINIISKASETYSDLITEGLLFVDGAISDPSKEKIYVDALQKALMSLYSTNLE